MNEDFYIIISTMEATLILKDFLCLSNFNSARAFLNCSLIILKQGQIDQTLAQRCLYILFVINM